MPRNGMVCSVDQLATSAGVVVLRRRGSAADAAVTASAELAVTTQHMCGLGGDLFALVHHGDPIPAALAAVGRAGSGDGPEVTTLECTAPTAWETGLTERGHRVVRAPPGFNVGHAQLIMVRADGMLAGTTDPRAQGGAAAGW